MISIRRHDLAALALSLRLTRALLFALLALQMSVGRTEALPQVQQNASTEALAHLSIDELVQAQITAGKLPGAVLLIGDDKNVLYWRAFGERTSGPRAEPMTEDTIFDLASLTKVVATTTAVLQLVERGLLQLDNPVMRYWPAFGVHGKQSITIRQLLAHTSGLRPDLDLNYKWNGEDKAISLIESERPVAAPGQRVIYSDINFEALGELVARVSGMSLEAYCQIYIFGPLAMHDTGFHPPLSEVPRIAPTVPADEMARGVVHDPTAYRMGGVAGHAGLFSSAGDLARFARAILNGGQLDGVRILKATSIASLLAPQSPPYEGQWRGLGWQLLAPLAANRERLPQIGAIGHTGFTGTGVWIDPVTCRFVILLSNRVYARGKGDVRPLRSQILAAVSTLQPELSTRDIAMDRPQLLPYLPSDEPAVGPGPIASPVAAGIDVLRQSGFGVLKGLRVGLITNHTGLSGDGQTTRDILRQAPGVRLAALFSPEHGLDGKRDARVLSEIDPANGLPIYSLYGEVRRPSAAMLGDLDVLMFDIQDAGARFYTYISTMAYAMEAAAQRGIPFYVLDRPNPVGADRVEGPLLDADLTSFTGYFTLPVRHGMTVGELARMFNRENQIGADLRVIPMKGYRRDMWYDQTGLRWVGPSPNLGTLKQTILYPGVALIEGANVSVGRGTAHPFELLGAPWIDGQQLAHYLNERKIAGVQFHASDFIPESSLYQGMPCHGVTIDVTDRQALHTSRLGVELAGALQRLYPTHFQLDKTLGMIGSRVVLQEIREGHDPSQIAAGWQAGLARFIRLRAQYLLY